MKKTLHSLPKTLIAAVAIAAVSAVCMGDAVAGGSRHVTRSWSTPSGASGGMSKSVTRDSGTWTRDVTRTGPYGNTYQRNSQRVYDPATGSHSYNSTTTLPSGSTIERSRDVTRTDSGAYAERQVTGPGGASRSVTRSVEW